MYDYITQDIIRSRASQKAASLEHHAARTATFGIQVVQTYAQSELGHSAMASLADDKTLGALGQASLFVPATKQLFGSLTSDSLEVRFLPLTYSGLSAGVCPCPERSADG
jgi:hypothetical protein